MSQKVRPNLSLRWGLCPSKRESEMEMVPNILRPPKENQGWAAVSSLDCSFLSPGLHCQGLFPTQNPISPSCHVGGSGVNQEAWGKAGEWAVR